LDEIGARGVWKRKREEEVKSIDKSDVRSVNVK
jgi:hypothetical protein